MFFEGGSFVVAVVVVFDKTKANVMGRKQLNFNRQGSYIDSAYSITECVKRSDI